MTESRRLRRHPHRPPDPEALGSGGRRPPPAAGPPSVAPLPTSSMHFDLPPALEASEPPEARGHGRDDVRLLVSVGHRGARPRPLRATCPTSSTPATCWWSTPRPPWPPPSTRSNRRGRPGGPPVDPAAVGAVAGRGPPSPTSGPPDPTSTTTPTPPSAWPAAPPCASWPATGARGGCGWPCSTRRATTLDQLPGPPRPAHPLRPRAPRLAARAPTRPCSATIPGSAEMPSASRPFTPEVVDRLRQPASAWPRWCCTPACPRWRAASGPTPSGSRCRRPPPTAINAARGRRRAGGGHRHHRGAGARERLAPRRHWPTPDGLDRAGGHARAGRAPVDGLLTGWHEPEASHLLMLEAIAGRRRPAAGLRRRRGPAATCGTSSATPT